MTGASGFVGGEIALEFRRAGYQVTALVRSGSDRSHLLGHDITFVEGSITDTDAVSRAMAGQDYVCHSAALVPGSGATDNEYEHVNFYGTRVVCEAAVEAGISRLLHVSTAHTFGIYPGLLVDENWTAPTNPRDGYESSKAKTESLVLEFASFLLDTVVVNPTVVFGPRSRYGGRLINLFVNGRMPLIPIPDRILSLVYSGDVARGSRLALESGIRGERYILAGPAVTVREFIRELADATGRREPRLSLPGWIVAIGIAAAWGVRPVTRWKPPITVSGVRRGGTIYDGSKVEKELGLRYTPFDVGISATVASLQDKL